jgi:hypothetical protein
MLYPIELWVRARKLNRTAGVYIPARRRIVFTSPGRRKRAEKRGLLPGALLAVDLQLLELQQAFTASTVG